MQVPADIRFLVLQPGASTLTPLRGRRRPGWTPDMSPPNIETSEPLLNDVCNGPLPYKPRACLRQDWQVPERA